MIQRQVVQRFVLFSIAVLSLAPVSLLADDRPDWRTRGDLRSEVYERRGNYDVEGVVVSVDRNGNDFRLRTRQGTVHIEGRYAVPVYFEGRRYRINDLERGDRVAVDLESTWLGGYRARSVHVISSVSHRGDYYGRRGRDRYGDYRDDRYGRGRARYERLYGTVVSMDYRGDAFVVRAQGAERIRVDTRALRDRHSLRVGDEVEIEGYYDGRSFVAVRVLHDHSRGRRW